MCIVPKCKITTYFLLLLPEIWLISNVFPLPIRDRLSILPLILSQFKRI